MQQILLACAQMGSDNGSVDASPGLRASEMTVSVSDSLLESRPVGPSSQDLRHWPWDVGSRHVTHVVLEILEQTWLR